MADYLYDPTADINASSKAMNAGLGAAFAMVATQKQNEYKLAESLVQNIEALKEDVNIFGEKKVTQAANNLYKDMASVIKKNGSLDYGQVAVVKQKTKQIKQLKDKYEQGAEYFKTLTQEVAANKDNLATGVAATVKSIQDVLTSDSFGNATDTVSAMRSAYEKNLDVMKLTDNFISSIRPKQKQEYEVFDNNKNQILTATNVYKGFSANPITGKLIPPPDKEVIDPTTGQTTKVSWKDEAYAIAKQTNPQLIELIKRTAGGLGDEKELFSSVLDNLPMEVKRNITPAPQKSTGSGSGSKKQDITQGMYDLNYGGMQFKAFPLGTQALFKVSPTEQIVGQEMAVDKATGDYWVKGLVDPKTNKWILDVSDEDKLKGATTKWTKVALPTKAEFESNLTNHIKGKFPASIKDSALSGVQELSGIEGSTPALGKTYNINAFKKAYPEYAKYSSPQVAAIIRRNVDRTARFTK